MGLWRVNKGRELFVILNMTNVLDAVRGPEFFRPHVFQLPVSLCSLHAVHLRLQCNLH
jgi:hypothetical protein